MLLPLPTRQASPVEPKNFPTETPDSPAPGAAASAHVSTPQFAFNRLASGLYRSLFGGGASLAVPDFEAELRGTEAKPIDMQLALISQDVYDLNGKGVPGWTRLSADQLTQAGIDPASLEDPGTGLRAAIYQDNNGDHVLAFAGSRDTQDWLNNLEQGVGLPAAQYDQAVALSTQAKAAFGNSLAITGHSLGGGLASIAALATDTPAVTFNAAGLNDETIQRLIPGADVPALRQQAGDGLIRRYAVSGEILTTLQQSTPLPDAFGHEIELPDPDPVAKPNLHWYDWLDGKAELEEAKYKVDVVKHSTELHSMDAVLAALNQDHPWTA